MSASCPERLELASLVDYWFGELPEADEERVEEHLLGCEGCSARLRDLVGIGEGVRRLAQQGAFNVVVSPSFLETASRQGLRVREYTIPSGGRVACSITADDDLLVARLQGDFRGVAQLDLVAQVEGGSEQRVEDLPFDPSSRELLLARAMSTLRALGSGVAHIRLLAPEPGGDRLVGEYTFAHTASGR